MNTAVAWFLGIAVAVIVIAILATLLTRRSKRRDANASRRDGDATATWLGIRGTRDSGPDHDG